MLDTEIEILRRSYQLDGLTLNADDWATVVSLYWASIYSYKPWPTYNLMEKNARAAVNGRTKGTDAPDVAIYW